VIGRRHQRGLEQASPPHRRAERALDPAGDGLRGEGVRGSAPARGGDKADQGPHQLGGRRLGEGPGGGKTPARATPAPPGRLVHAAPGKTHRGEAGDQRVDGTSCRAGDGREEGAGASPRGR
jgi:hypothetical protein